jgi:DNA-binding PadR family transcriptional regulator
LALFGHPVLYIWQYYVRRSTMAIVSVRGKSTTGRRWRENDPPVLILTSLASGPKHGHALLLDIESFAGVRLGPGTLYGAIGRLEERGLIEPVTSEGRARPYRLTADGSAVLEAMLAELRSIVAEGSARLRAGVQPGVTRTWGVA